jgi:hypothetical protein
MTLEASIAAAERTEAARQLIDRARTDLVELVTVSALELCVLGGPRHPLFEESVARAWVQLGNRRREKIIGWVTEGMIDRGLLVKDGPGTGCQRPGRTYALKPELGLTLAARCRPGFVVVTEVAGHDLRAPRFFALGDQADPVRGMVAELPTMLPADVAGSFPYVRKFGPLGWFYRYVLLSLDGAAGALAELTIAPPLRSGQAVASAWLVSAYHPDRKKPFGYRLSVRGDGIKARLDDSDLGGMDSAGTAYDIEGLRSAMFDLITQPAR